MTPDQKLPVDGHQPTSIEDWGRAKSVEGFIVELPSGNRCKVRRTLDLPFLLKSGQIPNPLAGIVQKQMDTQRPDLFLNEAANHPQQSKIVNQLGDMLDAQVVKMMIEPKVSRPNPLGMDPANGRDEDWDHYLERIRDWQPDEGTLSVFDISMEDKVFLFSIGQGMAADLESFRAEAIATLDVVQAGKNVARTPKSTSRTGGGTPKKRGAASRS